MDGNKPLFSFGLGHSQLDGQSPIMMSASAPDPNISGEKDQDHQEDANVCLTIHT